MFARRLLDALFTRPQDPIRERHEASYRVSVDSPLTAFEAYDAVESFVLRLDSDALCTRIESRSDVPSTGRAAAWRVTFRLPIREAAGRYDITFNNTTRSTTIEEIITPGNRSTDGVVPVPFRDSDQLDFGDAAVLSRIETTRAHNGRTIWRVTQNDGTDRELPLAA